MWKYSRGACYIIYDPPTCACIYSLCGVAIRVNNIRACVCFTICYFRQERKTRKKEKKKKEYFSYIRRFFSSSPSLPYIAASVGCSMPLHYALKIKTVGRERKPCAINSRGLTVSLFFPCHKITESAGRRTRYYCYCRSYADGMFGRAGKKFPNIEREI